MEEIDNTQRININEFKSTFESLNYIPPKIPKLLCEDISIFTSQVIKSINFDSINISELVVSDFQKKVEKIIAQIKNPDCVIKSSRYLTVLNLLDEIGWPFYLYVNEDNCEDFLSINNEVDFITRKKLVSSVVYKKCNESFIDIILKKWNQNPIISKERKILLKNAIHCYQQHIFSGCVTLLTCNLEGIITDLHEYAIK